jgi:hypothetical protein
MDALRILDVIETDTAPDVVAEEIIALSPDADEDWAEDVRSQCERAGSFTLAEVEVAALAVLLGHTDATRVAAYAALTSPPPPLVLCDKYVAPDTALVLLDGHHRLAAALARCDRALDAWIPGDRA